MSTVMIIQSSLRKDSRTAVITQEVVRELEEQNIDYDYLDLRDVSIPFCDGRSIQQYAAQYPDVARIAQQLEDADTYIIAFPVYMYSISGVLKNFLDIFGAFMEDKYFGIVLNAGGSNGYMASADLVNLMRFECRGTAIMPQVYAYKSHFVHHADGRWELIHVKPKEKIRQMIKTLLEIHKMTLPSEFVSPV